MNHKATIALLIFLLLLSASTRAAEFCVTSSAQFQAALTTAATNGQDDVIKVATGLYNAPSGGFIYSPYGHGTAGDGDFDLTIIGGYSDFFGDPCGQIVTETPWQTTLSGQNQSRVLTVMPKVGSSGNITIRLLTFSAGKVTNGFGGGLSIGSPNLFYGGHVSIERNVFIANEAQSAAAIDVIYNAPGVVSKIRLINNVVLANRSIQGDSVRLVLQSDMGGLLGSGIFAISNTVVNNTAEGFSSGGLFIVGTAPNKYVINNNLWGNGIRDLHVSSLPGPGDGVYSLWNNNIGARIGSTPDNESGNISVEPEYEPCGLWCFDLIPSVNSALNDAGRNPPPLPLSPWGLTNHDARGYPRIDGVGQRVDIGAYESHDRFFVDRFED